MRVYIKFLIFSEKEQRDLIPDLLTMCITRGNFENITWKHVSQLMDTGIQNQGDIGRIDTAAFNSIAMRVLSYLISRLHLFRYLGEADWNIYHANKPYQQYSSCSPENFDHYITAQQLPGIITSNSVISPQFCSDGLFSTIGKPYCLCSHKECSQFWSHSTGNGWMQGLVDESIASLAPSLSAVTLSATESRPTNLAPTLRDWLQELMSLTRFESPIRLCVARAQQTAKEGGIQRKKK